jgi:hypothetical protein
VTFTEDHSSRTGDGPINLETLRGALINTLKAAGYPYIPETEATNTTATGTLYYTATHGEQPTSTPGPCLSTLAAPLNQATTRTISELEEIFSTKDSRK